ncbi:MAG: hypothetical protein QXH10_08925 [Ignisphaera sp.]|uniref:DUF1616 domain-containing protein n=1 Tax=Ignisphaera aggregans TaxID=334771 RepID=A0A7C4NM60_9CREN
MNLLDEEVFAVIIAISIVGSTIAIALVLRPDIVEPFQALGLLNENLVIGDYPKFVYPMQNLTLGIFVYNHRPYPILVQIRYKIGNSTNLPTNTTPSSSPTIKVFEFLVDVKKNVTQRIDIPIIVDRSSSKVALIFELWMYDTDKREWVYTGIWNHHYVDVLRVPMP